jgi:hypothetical protein
MACRNSYVIGFVPSFIIASHYLLAINAQVWQGFVCHLQPPHLSHLQIAESGMLNASTTFLTPTHPQSMH